MFSNEPIYPLHEFEVAGDTRQWADLNRVVNREVGDEMLSAFTRHPVHFQVAGRQVYRFDLKVQKNTYVL